MPWKHKSGKGLWTELVNEETGESSLTEHKLKTVWQSCEDCYFVMTGNREATCQKCGRVRTFVLGMEILKDGHFFQISP